MMMCKYRYMCVGIFNVYMYVYMYVCIDYTYIYADMCRNIRRNV